MKLKITNRRKTGNTTNMWKLNNTGLNNQRINEQEVKWERKEYLEIKENGTQHIKTFGMQKKQF